MEEQERQGLFSRIGGGLKKFAKSGFGQALGHAAGFAVNPVLGVGLLAARGEFGPGGARERKELENDQARENLRSSRGSNDAHDDLQGLLSRTGAPVTGTNATPAFQLEAIDGLAPGTAGAGATPIHNVERGLDEIDTVEGQAKKEGLLSRLATPQFANSEFGTSRSNTTGQKISAYIDEGIRQGHEGQDLNDFVNLNLAQSGRPMTPLETSILQEQLREREARNAAEALEATEAADEKTRIKKDSDNQMRSTATNLLRLSELNDDLYSGSSLTQPGLPFPDGRRNLASVLGPLGDAVGIDQSLSEGAANTDEFTSLANEIAIDRIDISGFNAGTEGKFNFFTSTKPSAELLGPANDAATSRMLQGLLLKDDHSETFSSIEREAIEDRIATLDARQKPADQSEPEVQKPSSKSSALESLQRQAGSTALDLTQRGGLAMDSFRKTADRITSQGLETVTDIKDQIRQSSPSPEEMVQIGESGLQDINDYITALKMPEVDVPDKAALLRRAEEARKFLEEQVEAARKLAPPEVINFFDLPE